MKFDTYMHPSQVPKWVRRMIRITGVEPWDRRIAWITREFRENEHMARWLAERCRLECSYALMHYGHDVDRRIIETYTNADFMEFADFACTVSRVYGLLSEKGQKRLRGRLLDGLKENTGLGPIQHEMSTIVNLLNCDYDIHMHDFETGGGYDFLANRGKVQIEVECKMISSDMGRKIHRRETPRPCRKYYSRLLNIF